MTTLWKELHLRALAFEPPGNDTAFLNTWATRIPRFTQGCSCKEFWAKWYRLNPPAFDSKDAYFAWTIRAHNAVNFKLHRPEHTVTEAREYWSTFLPSMDSDSSDSINNASLQYSPIQKRKKLQLPTTPTTPKTAATSVPEPIQSRTARTIKDPTTPTKPKVQKQKPRVQKKRANIRAMNEPVRFRRVVTKTTHLGTLNKLHGSRGTFYL